MLATTICYLDRQALTIASVVIKDQYHLTPADYATIVMAYTLAYGFMQPFAGRFIDWIGTRKGFAISVFTWSLASMAHVLGRGVLSFSLLRAVLGVTEAGNFPGAAKVVSEWFPPKERASATGIYNCGAGLGAIIAPILMGVWLIPHYGWRWAFALTSVLGFIWLSAWLRFYRLPQQHPSITPKELAYIEGGQADEVQETETSADRNVWIEVLSRREFWGLAIGRVLSDPVWGFYLLWIPLYLKDARGWNISKIGLFAWMPFLASDIGSLVGGALSSYLIKRGCSVVVGRKIAMCVFASLMPVALLAGHAADPVVAILLMCVAAFGHQAWAANILTLPADLFPKRMVACTSGLTAPISTAGSLLATYLIGQMFLHKNYMPVFTAAGIMHPLGAVMILLLVRSRRRTKTKEVPA